MPSRDEMIKALKAQQNVMPSREEMIATLKQLNAPPEITKTQSAVRGATQGATMGFADEISGAAEALWNKAKGDPQEFGNLYKKYRDESRQNFSAAQKANPGSYTSGEVGATIASALIPGTAIAKGASLANVALKSALLGAATGAGYSEKEDVADIAKDAAKGAATSAVLGAGAKVAAPYAGRAIEKVGDRFKGAADKLAARALGAERGTIKKLGAEKVYAAGRQALDEGVVSPLASAEKMAQRNAAIKQKGGEKMSEIYKAIDDKNLSTFNPLDVATKIEDDLGNFYRSPINRGETKQLENTLESVLMRGDKPIPLKEAQALKEELGRAANWKNNLNITEKEKMARSAYKIVSNEIDRATEEGAKQLGSGEMSKLLSQGKKLYGNAKTSEKLLENRIAREQGNNLFGLTDTIAGAGSLGYGATTGDWSTAAGIMVAKKGLGKFGAGTGAAAANKIGNILAKAPSVAAVVEKNPLFAERAITSITRERGPQKWAKDGLGKLMEHNKEAMATIPAEALQDKKAIELLAKASDLKPGSKAMQNILERIQVQYGSPLPAP